MGFFNSIKKSVNDIAGSSYRDIYFGRNPGRYHTCKMCKTRLDKEAPGEITIDHIIPQRHGGTNAITNLQVLCRACNSSKNAKINALTIKYSGQALVREIKNTFR